MKVSNLIAILFYTATALVSYTFSNDTNNTLRNALQVVIQNTALSKHEQELLQYVPELCATLIQHKQKKTPALSPSKQAAASEDSSLCKRLNAIATKIASQAQTRSHEAQENFEQVVHALTFIVQEWPVETPNTITTRSDIEAILEKLSVLENEESGATIDTSSIDGIVGELIVIESKMNTMVSEVEVIESEVQEISQQVVSIESIIDQGVTGIEESLATAISKLASIEESLLPVINSSIDGLSADINEALSLIGSIENTTNTTASMAETINLEDATIISEITVIKNKMDQGFIDIDMTFEEQLATLATAEQVRFNTINTNLGTVNTTATAAYNNTVTISNKVNSLPSNDCAPTPIYNTGSTINISQSGTYALVENITCNSGNAISINTSFVTLDLNGFEVTLTGGSANACINIPATPTVTEVTIRNGSVKATNTAGYGVNLENSGGCMVNNLSIKNTGIGLRMRNTRTSIINNLVIDGCTTGIASFQSSSGPAQSCLIGNSTISNCSSSAISLEGATNAFKIYTCIIATNATGISAGNASNCLIENCLISNNTVNGINLGGSAFNNVISSCTILNNTGIGINDSTTNNQYYNNTACGNGTNYSSNVIASSTVTSQANANGFNNIDCNSTDLASSVVIESLLDIPVLNKLIAIESMVETLP